MHRSTRVAPVGTSCSRFLLAASQKFPTPHMRVPAPQRGLRSVREAHQSGPGCTLSSAPWRRIALRIICGRDPPVSVHQQIPLWPVSASPNLALRRIGSNGALQPRAPFAAVRAPLRAYGYSACSVGVGQTHDLAGLVARPWPAWASDSGVRGLVRPLTGGVEPGPR